LLKAIRRSSLEIVSSNSTDGVSFIYVIVTHTTLSPSHLIIVVLNGFEDYVEEDTKVAILGGFETVNDRFRIDKVVDLCALKGAFYTDDDAANGDDAYNGDDAANNGNDDAANGDDANKNDDFYNDDAAQVYGDDGAAYDYGDDGAYNDDAYNYGNDDANGDDANANGDDANANGDDDANANDDAAANRFLEDECPADGVYDFSAYMRLPNGRWSATGWGATADVRMYGHDGSLLGACQMTFKTPTSSIFIMPASVLMGLFVVLGGGLLFYGIYYLIKRETMCTYYSRCCTGEEFFGDSKDYRNMEGEITDDGYESFGGEETDSEEVLPQRFGHIANRIRTSPAAVQGVPVEKEGVSAAAGVFS